MKTRRLTLLGGVLAGALLLAGCPDDDDQPTTDTIGGDTATGDTTGDATTGDTMTDTITPDFPPPPALGATQIDRIGRPGVSTALVGTFDGDATARGELKDDYNAAAPSEWPGFASEIAANLAIYDGLDTVCGNQLAAAAELTTARYAALAGVLSNDRLWVNTASSTCTTYLAVEANATGILANEDCGGRRLAYDVIDTTYSALAAGAFAGVGDGVAADDGMPSDTFPFLAPPGPPFPSPPALGATQIDRIGRPGVSTALVGTFNGDATARGELKDDYNAAAPSEWPGFAGEIAANLAIYDGLDTVCGNQLAAGAALTPARYAALAGVLSNDRLWVNTAATTCTTYLAVEANATGILANEDCGGRQLAYDVIDTTYSALAAGAFAGVGDGVDGDDQTPSATFPFLVAPVE